MKEKRYTLQEEQPIPVGWHPANEEEAVARRLETFYQYRRFQKELQKEAEIAVLDKEWNLTYNALRG